jgi:thiosulfate reductase cytochrome b subunit
MSHLVYLFLVRVILLAIVVGLAIYVSPAIGVLTYFAIGVSYSILQFHTFGRDIKYLMAIACIFIWPLILWGTEGDNRGGDDDE